MTTDSTIGELLVAGDSACRAGDLTSLGIVAQRVAELAREPLHCELAGLAHHCAGGPDEAAEAWIRLKQIAWTCLVNGRNDCATPQSRST